MYISRVAAVCAIALFAVPAAAGAQVLGIGPRMTFVRADPALEAPNDRYTGGTVRLKISPRAAIELAMDLAVKKRIREDASRRAREAT